MKNSEESKSISNHLNFVFAAAPSNDCAWSVVFTAQCALHGTFAYTMVCICYLPEYLQQIGYKRLVFGV